MPDISFYILPSQSERERQNFACKLIEKAYRTGHKIYILTASDKQNQQMDDLLWTFRAGSFVPHQIYTGSLPAADTPILLGTLGAPADWQDTIINLSNQSPDNVQKSARILEILDASETSKQAGRNRYRQYQEQGLQIETHKL